jgi:amino-acid N-acetyltransferase
LLLKEETMIASQVENANIRPATAADFSAVERLLTESELPLDGVRESFGDFVVAESAGEIVGVAGLEICGGDALLRSVAVRPEWRSRGVGGAVVRRAIADAESRGLRSLYLLTTTAERYFPSFGFESVDRAVLPTAVKATKEFTSACPDTAVAMRKEL